MPRDPPPPLHLPGDHLEGGGQLLRNALTLSVLTRTPIHITAIRGNRPSGGGLKPQHVSCIAALAMLSEASVGTAPARDMFALSRGLKDITFRPGMGADWSRGMWGVRMGGRIAPPRVSLGGEGGGSGGGGREGGDAGERVIEVDIGSNGAVTMVLQAILPVVVFGAYKYNSATPSLNPGETEGRVKSTIYITGGTNVTFSPSIEYINQILFPTLTQHLHLPPLSLTLLRRGWTGSSELGKIKVSVEELKLGEGVSGFRIEPDPEMGERVGKVCITLVLPTEREVEVWSEIARRMVKAKRVSEWRVSGWRFPPQTETEGDGVGGAVDGVAEVNIGEEVEVEISSMTTATLPPLPSGSTRASGVGGANAQSYYVMVHTVSKPSGWRMGYDVLYTSPKSAKLPGLVGDLDNKRSSSSRHGKKKRRRHSKANEPHTAVWPPLDTSDALPPTDGGDEPDSPELAESRLLAHRILRKPLSKLKAQWLAGEVVDEYLRDQLVIYQALCVGESFVAGGEGEMGKLGGVEVTGGEKEEGSKWGTGSLHVQTARWVAREICGVEWRGVGMEGCRGVELRRCLRGEDGEA